MRFPGAAWLAAVSIFAAGSVFAAGTPASIFNPASQVSLQVGLTISLGVTVTDSGGNPLSGITVIYSAPSSGASGTFDGKNSATAVSDAMGHATPPLFTANSTAGTYPVTASTLGAGFQVISFTFTLTNLGPPATITAEPATQSVTIGQAVQVIQLNAVVKDSAGNLLPGVSVTFSAPSSGATGVFGSSSSISNTTFSNGDALVFLTVNLVPGTFVVTASALGANFQVISTTITITNIGPPAIMTPLPGSTPQSVAIEQNFPVPPGVKVTDAAGYPLAAVTVKFTAPSTGPGLASGNLPANSQLSVTNAAGIAMLGLNANSIVGGPYAVTAEAGGVLANFIFTNLPATGGPVVTQNPSSTTVAPGATASFVAAATGNPTPMVQWQQSIDSGANFANISGATSNTLSFTAAASQNNYQYRAVFFNSVNTATTTAAILTVQAQTAPVVTQNPANTTVAPGATASFAAAASGNPTPTVQWQQSTDSGATFTNIAGATSNTYSFTAAAGQNNYQYRAVFTNSVSSATTTAAILTVQTAQAAPVVTQNPANTTVAPGATASFVAAASGNPTPTVQWQQSIDTGATFTNIAGATSNTYSFTAAAGQNNYQYRAVFTNSVSSATTTAAILTVQTGQAAPVVTQNPASTTVAPGAIASFVAAASGNPTPTVQWQQSPGGGAIFVNVPGATSNTLSFAALASENNYQFRAVFTNSVSSATTTAAVLTVQASTPGAPVVTQNPSSITVAPGATASFTAAATGNPTPTVQWQQSPDGGATFTDIAGATSTTLSFPASISQNGYQYRAIFSNTANTVTSTATTSAAILSITSQPTIRSVNPVVPSFLGNAGFSSNMYVEIYGVNFSTGSRLWAGSDFNGIIAPTSLDGVSVKVNNKPAFVYYISPTQININVPEDSTTGPVSVQVQAGNTLSNSVTVPRSSVSPALETTPQFNVGGIQYVAALTPDFASFIGKPNLIPGASFVTAKPGDNITIYALGAGPTTPATQAGIVASVNSPLSLPYQLKIGGVVANVPFAGLVANTIGLYQLNVVVPQVPPGDQTIEFIVNGVSNNQSLFITIGS